MSALPLIVLQNNFECTATCARRRHGPRHDRHSYAHACDRLKSSGRLYCLAPGARPALSDLPLVCSAEGEWQGMVAELSMTRISSVPQFTMELAESEGGCDGNDDCPAQSQRLRPVAPHLRSTCRNAEAGGPYQSTGLS